ncbi:acyltransferase [Pseudomonas fluorescens]|uniref:acyltransferase family protein n=1 Tax=Pseudomonas fluorescens TaxID=294 RepID=UPI001907A07F|nr:acyltransferase [Pseudomonas fluorescens]MBD8091742.1 acyltransferase [Pseudomonas fluorescens]MBD8716135.1 acyltransferase [Pseudomonas fluorescens]
MRKKLHYAGADGIRGFACIIVLFVHAVAMFFNASGMALAGTGKLGVWLFFVLSAFLLTRKFAVGGFSIYSITTYALGRFIRIIPLFALVAWLYYLFGTVQINTPFDLMNAVTLKQGFGHLWTIPVEFKFYAFLPVIAFALLKAKQHGGHFSVLLSAVALVFAQQWLWPYWETVENSVSTRWYLSSFTIGCYFAASFDFYQARVTPRIAAGTGVAVVALMVLSSPYMRNIILDMPMDKWLQNKFIYLSLLWGVFVVALADGKGWMGAILQSRIMKKFGAWSFSIYLVHWYFYVTFGLAHPNSVLWMLIGIACAVAFGAFLHYAVEAPIEKFRHSLQVRIWPRSATAA